MNLSKKERINLINQYKILALLDSAEADHYNQLIEILESGYQVFYSQIDQWVSDDMPKEEGRFVLDVLNMYRMIENFKRKTTVPEINEEYFSFFRGFDGNEETEYMSFARFLIETQGKFTEQRQYLKDNDNLNSHMPTLEIYRVMLKVWNEYEKPNTLSEDQVKKIINARKG